MVVQKVTENKSSKGKAIISEFVKLKDGTVVRNHVRHDFTEKTRVLLFRMAGGVCSNPHCFKFTTGANYEKTSHSGVADAAHICAASPSPPAARYDASQSKEERRSADNGIWLCSICARIIDSNPSLYTVELLKEWKRKAFDKSFSRLGKKSYDEDEFLYMQDALNAQIIDALRNGLSAIGKNSGPLVAKAVVAYQQSLVESDERFNISTTVVDGAVNHVLSAKNISDSRFSVVATGDAASELQDKIENHRLTGQGFKIDSAKIDFINNDIFQEFKQSRPGSYLYLKPAVLKVQSSLYLVSANSRHFLCAFESNYIGGEKVISVEGESLDGFLSFDFKVNGINSSASIEFKTSIESWFGHLVSRLKHLPKYLQASRYLDSVSEFGFLIEYENADTLVQIPPAKAGCYIQNNESTINFKKCLAALCALYEFSKILPDKLYVKHSPLENDLILLSQRFLELNKGPVLQTLEYGSLIFSERMDSIAPELANYFCSGGEGVYFSLTDGARISIEILGNLIECPPVVVSYEGFEVALYYGIHGDDSGCLFVNLYSNQETKITFSLGEGDFILRK